MDNNILADVHLIRSCGYKSPLDPNVEYTVTPTAEYDAILAELADMREQVRWRKYPEEKPDGRKGRMLEIVTRPSGHRIPYCIYDVEEEVFFEARKHEHQYSAFSVTHFSYMPHPPEEA